MRELPAGGHPALAKWQLARENSLKGASRWLLMRDGAKLDFRSTTDNPMGAFPNKKSSVVRLDSARRRRRQPAGPEKPHPPSPSVVALAVAVVIAAATTTFGLWIVFELVQRGNYVGALIAPFWVILPGCAPLGILIYKRRRAARAHSNVTRFTAIHNPRRPQPRKRS
jgi:hypothetical protein